MRRISKRKIGTDIAERKAESGEPSVYRLGVIAVLLACFGSGLENPLDAAPCIGAWHNTSHRECQFALPRATTVECVADPEELDRTGISFVACLILTQRAKVDAARFRLLRIETSQPDVLPATPENLNNCLQT